MNNKTYLLVILFFIITLRLTAESEEWFPVTGTFSDIFAGGSDSLIIWAVGMDAIYKGDGKTWSRRIPFGKTAKIKRIGMDLAGNPMIVNQDGDLFQLTVSGKWEHYSGIAVSDFSVGYEGSLFAVGKSKEGLTGLFKWMKNHWEFWSAEAVQVSVDAFGTPWILDDQGNIYKWKDSFWQQWPGKARRIAISNNGQLWIITEKKNLEGGYWIAKWEENQWRDVKCSAAAISLDPWGRPWIVDSNGRLLWGKID